MKRIPFVDSHTGGEPTRVVLSGVSEQELELYRRALICEPRGHEVIVGALLVPPTEPDCVASVIFFNNVGLLGMCGHGMIGLIATLWHLGRVSPGVQKVQTPVGVVTAVLHESGEVSVQNVRSYRAVKDFQAGAYRGDIAWGGNWFFLVSDHGLDLHSASIAELTAAAQALRAAVNAAGHPEVDHVELFGPALSADNHSRNFVLCPGGEYDRSPCGTGTSAKLACLAADGKLQPGQIWRQESIIGSVFEGSYETADGGIVPTITGRAFLSSEGELLLEDADPFRLGIKPAAP
jgi:4-hydroxyproline epimerase